jgi:O-antigen/teichoic acid export membrane protein
VTALNTKIESAATVREVGRGAVYITLAKVVFLLAGTATNLLLPQFLSMRAYGDYGVVIRLISLLNMMTVTGLLQSVSRLIAECPTAAASLRRRTSLIATVAGAAIAAAYALTAPLIALALRDSALLPALAAAALITVGYGGYAAAVGAINGLRHFRTQALLDMGFSLTKCVGVLGAAFLCIRVVAPAPDSAGTIAAVLGFAVAALLLAVVAQVSARRAARSGGDALAVGWPALARRMLAFAGAVMLYQAMLNALMSVDLLLVKRYASGALAGAAGIYNAAVNVAQVPYFAVVAITFVAFPLVSASTFGDDRATTGRYVRTAFRYGALIAVGCATAIEASASDLLALLFPAGYGAGTAALELLVLGYAALALAAIGCTILNAVGRPLWSLASMAIATALAAALIVALSGRLGLLGAAIGTASGAAVALALTLLLLWRATGAGPALLSTLRIVLAGAIVVAIGAVLPPLGAWWALPELAGLGLFFLLILVVGRELGPADLDVARALLGRRRS